MVSLSLTGCQDAIPEMTEEEQVMVTSYAASLLLKYDTAYETKLLNKEKLEKEEALKIQIEEEAKRLAEREAEKEAKKQKQESEKEASGDVVEEIFPSNPAEFLNLDGITVSYGGVEYLDQYPNDGEELFFATNASEGCKLAVVHLVLGNSTSEVKTADVFSTNAKFKISFNEGDFYHTMSTLFSDDFSVYQGEIQPGETVDTVLIVDLKETECVDVQTVDLYMKANGQTLKTRLSGLGTVQIPQTEVSSNTVNP